MLELNLETAVKAINKNRPEIVALQIPEGLKQKAAGIAAEIEKKTGSVTITFVDPCYGACDLADARAKALGAKMLIHFGHTPFLQKAEIETVYLPLHYKLSKGKLNPLAETVAKKVGKGKKIVLCTTAQYLHLLSDFSELLGKKGLKVVIGKGKGVEKGQVLGCNYSSVKTVEENADAVVFLGDGLFHPIGISFCSDKPVFTANPFSSEANELKKERELFLRKRGVAIARAIDANVFGIMLSTKRGQARKGIALALKKKIESSGRKALVFASDFVRWEYFLGMEIDALVSTACPRIAFDDTSSFKQPLLSPAELEIVLGKRKMENYRIDEFLQ